MDEVVDEVEDGEGQGEGEVTKWTALSANHLLVF